MAKVTFTTEPVVRVTIVGEGKGPEARKDGGLVMRFIDFAMERKIYPSINGGMSGNGMYEGFYTAENAAKIEAWLLGQGVERYIP